MIKTAKIRNNGSGWFGDPVSSPKDCLKRVFLAFHAEDLVSELELYSKACLQSEFGAFSSLNGRERMQTFRTLFPPLVDALLVVNTKGKSSTSNLESAHTSLKKMFDELEDIWPEHTVWELLDACVGFNGPCLSDKSSVVPFCKALLDLLAVARNFSKSKSYHHGKS